MSPAEREQLIEETLAHYRALLERRLAENPGTLAEIEQTVEEISQEMDRILEQRILDIFPSEANQASCPQCPATARFRRAVLRQVLTSHGERTVVCRYFYCTPCGYGFTPREVRLALPATRVSQQVQLWIAARSARMPFAEVAEDLAELRSLTVSVSTIERSAVAVGQALCAAEVAGQAPELPTASAAGPPRLYLSMDGVFAPLRDPWKNDGSVGKLHCRFGECRVGLAYVARPGTDGDCGITWRAYMATLDKVEAFAPPAWWGWRSARGSGDRSRGGRHRGWGALDLESLHARVFAGDPGAGLLRHDPTPLCGGPRPLSWGRGQRHGMGPHQSGLPGTRSGRARPGDPPKLGARTSH